MKKAFMFTLIITIIFCMSAEIKAEDVSLNTIFTESSDRAISIQEYQNIVTIPDENINPVTHNLSAALYASSYREKVLTMNVNSSFKPKMKIYYETTTPGSYFVKKVLNVTMDSNSNGSYYPFQGTVYLNLESQSSLYISVSGGFYKTSATTITANAGINISSSATLGFSVSSTDNLYSGYSQSGRVKFSASLPGECIGNLCASSVEVEK